MKRINFKVLALVLLGILVVIQVFSIDKSAPDIVPSEDFFSNENVPDDVKLLLKEACKDCHSYKTTYPWYTNIEPLSWWIKGHINFGREQVNFSKWNTYDETRKARKIDECIEVLEQQRMPFKSYTWLHPEARLDDNEYKRLIAYFESVK